MKLLILSGKGGTGKTTIASAFIRLSQAKRFADCDVDAPNLHLVLEQKSTPKKSDYYGLPKANIDIERCSGCGICYKHCQFGAIEKTDSGYSVNPFSCEGCGVCEALCDKKAISLNDAVAGELMLYHENKQTFSTAKLKMGSGTSGKLVTAVKRALPNEASDELTIIDGSPGIGCPVIASIAGVNMVLVVTEPSISGITDMKRIIETAKKFHVRVCVCINKYDTHVVNSRSIANYCREQNISFVGTIPYDSDAIEVVNRGKTIVDIDCESGMATTKIYEKIINILFDKGE